MSRANAHSRRLLLPMFRASRDGDLRRWLSPRGGTITAHDDLARAIVRWVNESRTGFAVLVDVARVSCRRKTLGTPGTPDVLVFVPPDARAIGLEVKVGRDKMRPSQIEWARRGAVVGLVVHEVRSLNEAIRHVELARRGT